MPLSARLLKAAELIEQGSSVADIGCDHALLSIYLAKSGIARRVIACDIKEGPLRTARKNVEASGTENIDIRLSDGLSAVREGEVDTVVIAGMGGEVIAGIIAAAPWLKNGVSLILQPMTSAEDLRRYLFTNGFSVSDEFAVRDGGRLYSVMKARFSGEIINDELLCYIGGMENGGRDERDYIEKVRRRLQKGADELRASGRLPERAEEFSLLAARMSEIISRMEHDAT